MAGLAAIAAKIAASAAVTAHIAAPIGSMDYGRLHYDARAVNDSTGLGGNPAYCGLPATDIVQVVYTVTNRGAESLTTPAVPRLVLIGPDGVAHPPDRLLTELVALKANPPIMMRHGVLASGESVILADVFVLKRYAIRDLVFHLRPAPPAAQAILLPQSAPVDTRECPRPIGY
jgi:hypothetical protein